MCKRITIDIEWDDEHPSDAVPGFVMNKAGRAIRISEAFESRLYETVEACVNAQVTIGMTDIPRGGEDG